MSKKGNKNGRPYNPQMKLTENSNENTTLNENIEIDEVNDEILNTQDIVIDNNENTEIEEVNNEIIDSQNDAIVNSDTPIKLDVIDEKKDDTMTDINDTPVLENNDERKSEDHTTVTIKNFVKMDKNKEEKQPVYNNCALKENQSGTYKIVFVKNGSPLQISKILNRLKALSIDYEYDRASSTITGHSYNTIDMAIREKKRLVGKGLKPMIFEGLIKRF